MKLPSLLTSLFICSTLHAQPDTEIYLFDVGEDLQLTNPVNISSNPGYDNQPSFWEDGKSVLYARTVAGQTEIAHYSIETGATKIITNTLQGSEYSPTQMPDGRISSIRLDTTGVQFLYAYDMQGTYEVLIPDLVIGYHAWINEAALLAFVLDEPPTLQIIDTYSYDSQIIKENIGRSLHKIPGSKEISFVDKSQEPWRIYARDHDGNDRLLTETLEGSEDFCWTPNGEKIFMGKGSKLFYWGASSSWTDFFDLATFDLTGITRISISPDGKKLALVLLD
ncbi:MAG: hypothetical protein AAGA66_12375 [Bacteroidota bacterium]